MKVSAHGNEKQISIESQLLIMNNLLQPLTLKFVIRALNDSAARLKNVHTYLGRKTRQSVVVQSKKLENESLRKARKSTGHRSLKSVGFVEKLEAGGDKSDAYAEHSVGATQDPRGRSNFVAND